MGPKPGVSRCLDYVDVRILLAALCAGRRGKVEEKVNDSFNEQQRKSLCQENQLDSLKYL